MICGHLRQGDNAKSLAEFTLHECFCWIVKLIYFTLQYM